MQAIINDMMKNIIDIIFLVLFVELSKGFNNIKLMIWIKNNGKINQEAILYMNWCPSVRGAIKRLYRFRGLPRLKPWYVFK